MMLQSLVVVALLLLPTLQADSLCLSCLTSISNVCISCNTASCAAYSYLDSTNMCSCNPGYYLNSGTSGLPYCDLCFIGCLTCSGPLANQCMSCSSTFTYDQTNSFCTPPSSITDYTVQQAYYFLGFSLLTSWSWDNTASASLFSSSGTYTCGSTTLVGLGKDQFINTAYSSLQTHYAVRVMFAHYIQSTNVNQNIQISIDSTINLVGVNVDIATSNNPALSCGSSFIESYIDQSYTHSASSVNVRIGTTGSVWFGIQQFFIILKLCNSQCSSCTGYTSSTCTGCTDTNRLSNYTNYINQCVCYGSGATASLYYQEPVANTCVLICPSSPVQTFGQNLTRNCLSTCPNGTYAFTDVYRCWADCPTTSNITLGLLFRDNTTWRCVPTCSSAAPYANKDNRYCYAICPNISNGGSTTNYYAVNGLNLECVSVCPYNATFQLFGYQGNCITSCPSGFWGDPITKLCLTDCTSTSAYPYKDSSSGINVCVQNCTLSNYYRDNTTFTCVLTCPSTTFGENTRQCVTRCADGKFGLTFGNRICALYCPSGYFGEPDSNTCVNTPQQCKTATNDRYADTYTRTCVFPISCSLGYFADSSTQSCVITCPKAASPSNIVGATVGHPVSRVCQTSCASPYFADFVAGLCVTNCITNGTFSDVSSNRVCVTACSNTTGLTPWADSSTYTCVSACNNTIASFIADNTTFTCVVNCPANYYADKITTTAPICRSVCITVSLVATFADNSTGTGLCVWTCSANPPRFGDATGGMNLCVAVCTNGLLGDQTGYRYCVTGCPASYFAQNDSSRQCVTRCKPGTYGYNRICYTTPLACPSGFANDQNNLCDACNSSLGTFGDPVSGRCVSQCPVNPSSNLTVPLVYFADISIRQCVLTCNAAYTTGTTTTYTTGLFGNNNTRTCVFVCQDLNSYAQEQSNNPYRVCVARCFPTPVFHYANNQTLVCGLSIDCPLNQYGQNTTQTCVSFCPNNTYAYKNTTDKICIDICPTIWYGDTSTSRNLCVTLCPSIPSLFADPTTKLCVAQCPSTYYADSNSRTCMQICPSTYYALEPNRTCVAICPTGYFGNITYLGNGTAVGACVTNSSQCGSNQWGDAYLHKCVTLCSGPNPVSLYAYWPDCIATCPSTWYANTYNGARICTQNCPPAVPGVGAPNLYGDSSSQSCVSRCVTPLTWADFQTRLCQSTCSATPLATYSQNFYFTCVISLSCPASPTLTFGDNNTRSCVTNCSLGKFGDPTSRNCVTQCPSFATTGTSTFYGDTSTGQYICVTICPILPALFGRDDTNRCVATCPSPLYGDQTANRTCLATCPIVGSLVYFAQNTSRICVTVCITGTWGYTPFQECVETSTKCLALWADNTTNLCVAVCPATAGSFADPTTQFCVTTCPSTYYADYSQRMCVQTCPSNVYIHGTFGNNQTRICEQYCSPINGSITYADAQTVNRFCVSQCSQSPNRSFADPSTGSCVPICPSFPQLFGETVNFTCVASCPTNYYANTNTRICVSVNNCPSGNYKTTNPNLCVSVCPADGILPLYGDPSSGFCESVCTNNYFRYSVLNRCVSNCSDYGFFAYNMTCVKLCPQGFYANSSGICNATCPASFYGQNTTTTCLETCLTGYAYGSLCIAVCPNGTYGENFTCVNSCQISGNVATTVTNMCVSNCTNGTYARSGQCYSNCTTSLYADPFTNRCSGSCTNGRYADPTTNKCVTQCPTGYYMDSPSLCSTSCTGSNFADNTTWQCRTMCSPGYWGYNFLCILVCPPNYFGDLTDRICYTVPNRPSSTPVYFADNLTQTWVTVCPVSPLTFGDSTLRYCLTTCLNGSYSDPQTRQCQSTRQNTSYLADSTTNQWVLICPINWYGNYNTGQCETICTNGYAYDLQHLCVSTCPDPYSGYNNGTANICLLRCPTNYYSLNRLCLPNCPSPYYADNSTNQCVLSCEASFASNDSQICVPSCALFATFKLADNSTNSCVSICPSTPDYYSQNNICVKYCAGNTFADPTTLVRTCTSLCTTGLFSDPISRRCLASCPLGYWAKDTTNDCVPVCSVGFADNVTGRCMSNCPTPTFADSSTRRCVLVCPSNTFGQVNNTCMSKCTLPNYANPLTQLCEPNCPPFAGLFAQSTTASCVTNCSIVPNSYADTNVNACVLNCTLNNSYSLDGVGICTNLCPLGLFMQNSTKKCQATCTTGYAEPTTRYCVSRCFGNPQTYGYNGVCYYRCLNTTVNRYADNSTNLCVLPCPDTQLFYSDPLSGNCVLWCPEGYYAEDTYRTCTPGCITGFADNLTRKCVPDCPTSLQQTFADSSTSKCVRICPQGTYANNDSKSCVNYNQCPTSSWSDPISKYCVARCPSEPLSFGYNLTSSCVPQCPSPSYYGDYQTQTCRTTCPTATNGLYRFADPISRTCVYVCPILNNLYGDTFNSTNFTCVVNCSNGQWRDNSTQQCVGLCPTQPSYWADPNTNNCVYHCSGGFFASNRANRLCVVNCSIYLTFGDVAAGMCTSYCPVNFYSDNTSYLCVDRCPSGPDYYADNTTRNCVLHCPKGTNWTTFADSTTQTCVTECPPGSYAHNDTQRCVPSCLTYSQYADPIIRVCVQNCTVRPHYYKAADGTCTYQCPTSPIMAYKHDVNNSCVYTDGSGHTGCPGGYWANTLNSACTTLCPFGYYADQNLHLCVIFCPPDYYADPVDRLCKLGCSSAPEEYRLNSTHGICVQLCPPFSFADNSTYKCMDKCPLSPQMMYAYNVTWTCVQKCPPPYYAYFVSVSGSCVLGCPSPYFAQDSNRSCVTACAPPYYADDSTNQCVLTCPASPLYFGLNNVCRGSCPNGTFADNSTRLCVTQCPRQPFTFADNSTNKCVFNCPSTPNFYADSATMKCVYNCSNGTFAEVTSRSCVLACPATLMTYADPTTGFCQSACPSPYFASDLTKECVTQCPNTPVKTYALTPDQLCVQKCPQGLYGQNNTRTCATGCPTNLTAFADITIFMCVSTCPVGWFADNSTFKCVRDCPLNSFADNTTRKCLERCPGTERLYSDPSTWTCVTICPGVTYGNDQNWTCIPSCPPEVFGYMLSISNQCVEQCPSPFFASVPIRTCVTNCGAGMYGNVATRICADCPTTCPTCLSLSQCLSCTANLYLSFGSCVGTCPPGTYSNTMSLTCVYASGCPAGYFGNGVSSSCSMTCPQKQYPMATSKLCVACPYYCANCVNLTVCTSCITNAAFSNVTNQCYGYCSPTLPFGFNGTCYSQCPNNSYLDFTNVKCQACNSICLTCQITSTNCTACSSGFLFNSTCRSQCPNGYYASNKTCQVCTASVKSCSNPLSFKVTSTTQDYKNVVYLQFNQPTVINGDPRKFINLQLKVGRRLDTSSLVNGGMPFTAQIMPDGSIKLILQPGTTLNNPSFIISINDPTAITTTSGGSLQSLSVNLNNINLISYPSGTTTDAPLIVAATVLAITMLILLASVFVCSPFPVFLTLQAFQMIAFYAYVVDLPPNLFYFIKKLSITRLGFLPNVFSGVYVQPPSYTPLIPTRVIDVDGQLSFSVNAGSLVFILLLYLFFAALIYLLSSKWNSNRPLRELFHRIYVTRVKIGMVNDFLWMFALNVLVCGFMQFRYTTDGSQVALAVIFLLAFLAIAVAVFVYRVKYYQADDEQTPSNYRFWHQGVKDGALCQYIIWIYYLRKLLFAVFVVATISTTSKAQNACLITLSSLMLVALIVLRPYNDNLRNIVHIANEVGLTFLGGAFLYYRHYLDIKQPVGTQITCGNIITYVIIIHLGIALIWGFFRTYHYYRELYADFKKTQFYKLYLDDQYEDTLEKELQELNDDSGDVQSVTLTKLQGDEQNSNEEIIKLKIKRRRKIVRNQPHDAKANGRQNYMKPEQINERAVKRNEHFVKMDNLNEQIYNMESIIPRLANTEEDYVLMQIPKEQSNILYNIDQPDESKSNDWVQLGNDKSKNNDSHQEFNILDYNNAEEMTSQQHRNSRLMDFEEISSVSNKEEKISKEETDQIIIHLQDNRSNQGENQGIVQIQEEEELEQSNNNVDKIPDMQSEQKPNNANNEERQSERQVDQADKSQIYQQNPSEFEQSQQGQVINLDLEPKAQEEAPVPEKQKVDFAALLQGEQNKPNAESNKKYLLLFDAEDFD